MSERRGIFNVVCIALACACLLVLTRWVSAPRIAANESAQARAELLKLLSDASLLPSPLPDLNLDGDVWQLCNGLTIARLSAAGYAGPISLLLAMRSDPARIHRVRILNHQETPGITQFLQSAESGWLSELNNRTSATLAEVDTVSGATITSEAIRAALRQLLSEPPISDGCYS